MSEGEAIMARANIVVLGGGSGGVVAASLLGHSLGRSHNVTLIDQRPTHVFQSSYLWLTMGLREPRDITRDLTAVGKRHVRFLNDRVTFIDTDKRKIRTDRDELPYDRLVISLGFETHPEEIPGDGHAVHHAWEMDAALRLRERLARFDGGRIAIGIASTPYRCPPGPYELAWLLEDHLRRRGLRDRSEIDFFTPEAGPIGGSGQPSDFIREHLARRGITLHTGFALATVDGTNNVLRAGDGRELAFDLGIVIPPHRPSRVLYDSGLVSEPAGIAMTDFDRLETAWEGVYAIGDNANMPASKAGVVAHEEAEVVAHNIAVDITGRGAPTRLTLQTI
jgi:sulfide:quinone oxidoreductase